MADTNLGQISAIWLEDSTPPNTSFVWIKTINQLNNQKAAFIWNGIEWINIQGEGFEWKGIFDLQVNYKKRDIVSYNNALYFKKNDIVNNNETPNVSTNFDVFIPAPNNGINGINGQDGQDGKSAYQLWLDNENTGTEQDFFNSLRGQDGTDGIDGLDGTNGIDGVGLPIGGTTGMALVKNSDMDYDYSWVNLAGQDGADGTNGVGVPPEGTTGQLLAKVDNTDYNTEWVDPPIGGSSSNLKIFEDNFAVIRIENTIIFNSRGVQYTYSATSLNFDAQKTEVALYATQDYMGGTPIFRLWWNRKNLNLNIFKRFKVQVKSTQPINQSRMFVGLSADPNLSLSSGQDMRVKGFGFSTKNSAAITDNIYAFTSSDSTNTLANKTYIDTGIPFPVDTWIDFEIVKNGGKFDFFIDEVLVATIDTTRVSATPYTFVPVLYFYNGTGAVREFAVRYFMIEFE